MPWYKRGDAYINPARLAVLTHTEQEEHIDCWHATLVQPTLFEPVAVVYAWGNRQSAWQQIRIISAVSCDMAQEAAAKIIASKINRGHRVDTITIRTGL